MSAPNLFIVGAPKCGTTAMYHYLAQHPDVYMSTIKEPCFFGSDLTIVNRRGHIRELDPYLALFRGRSERVRGEASIWYLTSQRAAAEIRAFNRDARIVIMLRNPVDFLYSLHAEYLWNSNEDLEDFGAALAAEPDRKAGRRWPAHVQVLQGIYYREMASFTDQVGRYLDVFGRERVRVYLLDDLAADAAAVYGDAVRFLDIDAGFQPDLGVVNPQKQARSKRLQSLINTPPEGLLRTARALLPPAVRRRLFNRVKTLNDSGKPRPPMDERLRQALESEFRPEVDRLSALLDRDLTRWCRPKAQAVSRPA